MTDPLFHPGWIRFNEAQWGLTAEKVTLLPEKGDGWKLETVLYRNKKGLLTHPPRNPYLPMHFECATGRISSLNRRKRLALEGLAELLKKNRIKNRLTFSPLAQDVRPFLWQGMRAEPQFTYHIELDCWRDPVDPSALNRARKARSLGYACEVTTAYQDVCDCLKAAEERKKFDHQVSAEELKTLAEQMGDNLVCFVLKNAQGEIKGASVCLYTEGHVVDWSAAIKTEALQEGGNNILVEFLLDYFQEKGCKTFDFVGANIAPVARMKELWGGSLVTYYTIRSPGLRDLARTAVLTAKDLFKKNKAKPVAGIRLE